MTSVDRSNAEVYTCVFHQLSHDSHIFFLVDQLYDDASYG